MTNVDVDDSFVAGSKGRCSGFHNQLFVVLDPRCLTGSVLLDCHALKGFGIYMIGILDSLSGVLKPIAGTHHVTSTCNLSSIPSKEIESPFFLFRPLTKLSHPNTIYRAWCWQWVLALEHVLSRA